MISACSNAEIGTPYIKGQWNETPLRPGGLELTKRAVALCHLKHESRVLDLGCGTGLSAGYLGQEFGFDTVGIDLSLAACRQAGKLSGKIVRADAAHLPFAGASMDAVIAECSLSLMDKDTALAECFRVLRPTGQLILTDMYVRNSQGAAQVRELGNTCLSKMMTEDELETELACHGFAVKHWEDHSSLLKALLFRLLMEHGSLEPLFGCGGSARQDAKRGEQALREARPGYFLLIAVKRSREALMEGETS